MVGGTGPEEQKRTRQQRDDKPYSNNGSVKHSRHRL
jgi:hypothetical protein